MSQHYLLTCECGSQLAVLPRNAGEKKACTCGRVVDIPTLRVIRDLPLADEPQPRPNTSRWTVWHGTVFALGVPVLLAGLVAMAYAGYEKNRIRYRTPTVKDVLAYSPEKLMQLNIEELTPVETWETLWKPLRDSTLSQRRTPLHLVAKARIKVLTRWMWAAGIAAGAGLMAVLVALVSSRGTSKNSPVTPA